MFQTILFPIDQSQEARQAASVAIAFVKQFHARLIVLSVFDPDRGSDRGVLTALLEKASATFAEAGITAETRLEEGKPAFVICDIADDLNVDLIIMGSRGTNPTDEHPESVSHKVVDLSPCPVLVVP